MPRSKTGRVRLPVQKNNLKNAVDVLLRQYSICQAAVNNQISKTTLLRHLKINRETKENIFIYKSNVAHRRIFSNMEKDLLVDYLKTAAKLHYGLTKDEFRKLAYQFAIENKKEVPNSWIKDGKGGREWIR
ncbi:hypothetical protein ABEB36_012946 [Hypothenemus hampei]|uniref:Uncharacterized protein n=1 Tax=Hypothenemus hampei TaxID=57062 RepID=A0ABD1E771_HYPHA